MKDGVSGHRPLETQIIKRLGVPFRNLKKRETATYLSFVAFLDTFFSSEQNITFYIERYEFPIGCSAYFCTSSIAQAVVVLGALETDYQRRSLKQLQVGTNGVDTSRELPKVT